MKVALLLSLVLSNEALAGAIPSHVLYLRTGKESAEEAEAAGKKEIANGNPCAGPLAKDLESLASDPAMVKASEDAAKGWLAEVKPGQHLLLRLSNGSMILRYELRGEKPGAPGEEVAVFRKEVKLSERPGTWRKRVGRGDCRITEAQKKTLIELVAEPTKLLGCKTRKLELLDHVAKVSNFLHEYVPDKWVEEAKERLLRREQRVPELLRSDDAIYRTNNQNFRSCSRGLELLELESAVTLRLLRDMAQQKPELELPLDTLDALDRLLDSRTQ